MVIFPKLADQIDSHFIFFIQIAFYVVFYIHAFTKRKFWKECMQISK